MADEWVFGERIFDTGATEAVGRNVLDSYRRPQPVIGSPNTDTAPWRNDMHHAKICAAILLVLAPVAALAQSPAPAAPSTPAASPELKQARRNVRAACAADLQKFCA